MITFPYNTSLLFPLLLADIQQSLDLARSFTLISGGGGTLCQEQRVSRNKITAHFLSRQRQLGLLWKTALVRYSYTIVISDIMYADNPPLRGV